MGAHFRRNVSLAAMAPKWTNERETTLRVVIAKPVRDLREHLNLTDGVNAGDDNGAVI